MTTSSRHPLTLLALLTIFLLTSCQPASPSPQSTPTAPPPTSFVLVTSAPDPTATPTPFQPITPTASPYVSPTATPTATSTPLPTATETPLPTLPPLYQDPEYVPERFPLLEGQETVNFLLIGSDKRPGSSFRTDTLIVVVLRPKEEQVTLISIPRDLWVYIPTWGMNRINTAYQHGELYGYPGGGPGLLKDTIAYNLGIRIDHTAMVEFDGFRRIIDTLGGIDVPVACPYTDWRLISPHLNPYDENNWQLYTVGPGVVHMDGDLALWYARSRKRSSDFDRGRRQQEVLRAIYDRALRTDTLSRLPQLYEDLQSVITTDLTLSDLLQLAWFAPRLSNADVRSYYIRPPYVSSWITPGGAYVLLPDEAALQTMLAEALAPSPRQARREQITIEVQNGTPYEGWDALAAARLNYAGYQAHITPADSREYSQTLLLDFTPSQDPQQSASLLAILGLSQNSLISAPGMDERVMYRLVLGTDYQPCFRPEMLTP